MRINTAVHEREIVVAECCFLNRSDYPEESTKDMLHTNQACTVLFQKSSYHKQQMKPGKFFFISLPWHLIQLKSSKSPVIICKFFKPVTIEQMQQMISTNEKLREVLAKCQSSETLEKCAKNTYCSKMNRICETKQVVDFTWKKRLCIAARIQRIWNCKISVQKLALLIGSQTISRLTMLLQSKEGDFYLLSISSIHNLRFSDWSVIVEEGQFYFFENLKVLHRLERKRYPKIFKYVQDLLKEHKIGELKQDFMYKLGIDDTTKNPFEISHSEISPFLNFNYQPLSCLVKNSPHGRVSCRVKVLHQHRSTLYVRDESISSNIPYVKVFLHESTESFLNTSLSIKDAFISEGELHLDEYSQVSALDVCFPSISLNTFELLLKQNSSVTDIVSVEGCIRSVDESTACIWLQCCFCRSENLVQNTEDIIFCEDCCLVVNKPLIQMKMNVCVVCDTIKDISLNIELLSSTIKKILSLKENSYQQQRNVLDVLGKRIGPLLCYTRAIEMVDSHKVFYLDEVDTTFDSSSS